MSESSFYECCSNFGTHTDECSRRAARESRDVGPEFTHDASCFFWISGPKPEGVFHVMYREAGNDQLLLACADYDLTVGRCHVLNRLFNAVQVAATSIAIQRLIGDVDALMEEWKSDIDAFATKDDPYWNGVRQCLSDLRAQFEVNP